MRHPVRLIALCCWWRILIISDAVSSPKYNGRLRGPRSWRAVRCRRRRGSLARDARVPDLDQGRGIAPDRIGLPLQAPVPRRHVLAHRRMFAVRGRAYMRGNPLPRWKTSIARAVRARTFSRRIAGFYRCVMLRSNCRYTSNTRWSANGIVWVVADWLAGLSISAMQRPPIGSCARLRLYP
jgi:hypothetical protein